MHTQTPWRKVEVGITERPVRFSEHIAIRPLAGPTLAFLPYSSRSTKESQIENAALIVKAVNSYEAMRAALVAVNNALGHKMDSELADMVDSALALAEGKE